MNRILFKRKKIGQKNCHLDMSLSLAVGLVPFAIFNFVIIPLFNTFLTWLTLSTNNINLIKFVFQVSLSCVLSIGSLIIYLIDASE